MGALLALCLAAPAHAWTRVTLSTDEGSPLAATLWEPPYHASAGVVLVHAPSRTRHDWDRVGEQLAARGFLVLALDLRGHGDSPSAGAGDLPSMARDVAAAVRYLLERPHGSVGRVGVLGASAGGTLGVIAADGIPAVRAFAFLSTPLDFRGLRVEGPLGRVGDRALLAMASSEDAYAARSARALAATGPGLRELVLVEGAGHGVRMLSSRPDLIGSVVDWFSRTLL